MHKNQDINTMRDTVENQKQVNLHHPIIPSPKIIMMKKKIE
jgi:hypothetical protein